MKRLLVIIPGSLFLWSLFAVAGDGLNLKSDKISIPKQYQNVSPIINDQRDVCQLTEFNGNPVRYNASGYYSGFQTVQVFNPEDCGADSIFPFEITSLDFLLFDDGSGIQWPVVIDIVVYDLYDDGGDCWGPGDELCRFQATCDESTYSFTEAYPNIASVAFEEPCCVESSFCIGIEYTDSSESKFPSIIFDDNSYPDTCDIWMYYPYPPDDNWYEWYLVWSSGGRPGYPMWWVNGETVSSYCYMPDGDEDGIPDDLDNCPDDSNPGQENSDDDDLGDECDNCPDDNNPDQADFDNDTVGDECDNCPADENPDQVDLDEDGVGQICDNCPDLPNQDQADVDNDDVGDICDNCPSDSNSMQIDDDEDGWGDECDNCFEDYNPDQNDVDEDGIGDACDTGDYDSDGIPDYLDNCPADHNPLQENSDSDNIGDACDNCIDDDNPDQADTDGDTIGDLCDNCPTVHNPDQADTNGNDIGDVCENYKYLPGDANMSVGVWPPMCIGSDVTYMVGYFRGLPTSIPCELDGYWSSADVNGDCLIIGSDVTALVGVFRGMGSPSWCPDYEPAWPTPDDVPVEAPSGWPNCD
ncbi:MAG: hypothetical protein GY839_04980 [candidate division Zixibacteria bacterium]|nr:hypothetical protein [candidate division Zixibacteria bacterium]